MTRLRARLRALARKRWVRTLAISLASLLLAGGLFAGGFHVACRGAGEPDAAYARPELAALEASIPEYARAEESTYLTLLEWYQVFSYQEYADFIEDERPSRFPYFRAIGQSWSMYCHAYGYTQGTYPFNGGNHLMLGVIGVSFTAEYALKALYERTIGWVSQLDSIDTAEDRYAADVAADYGEFITTEPWYAYPFGAKAAGVWTENPFFGKDMLRKMERKSFLTLEYGVKAGYAAIIRVATGAIYGAPPARDHVWAENVTEAALAVDGVRLVRNLGNGSAILEIPHYQGFTDAVPELARRGVRFVDLCANDEIVLTALAPRAWTYALPHGEELFSLDVLTDPTLRRVVVRVPTTELHSVLLGLEGEGARIEHLFDY